MIIYIGADHNGFDLRAELMQYLAQAGYEVHDDGNERLDANDDYPVFATRVVNDMLASTDEDPRGILLCGSGQGIMIAANRYKGIRACLGYDLESVRSARNDDDCNVLALPAKILKADQANMIVEAFLNTPFGEAPRYQRRIKELDELS
jgi:ribose 5-phosphate isomerase B